MKLTFLRVFKRQWYGTYFRHCRIFLAIVLLIQISLQGLWAKQESNDHTSVNNDAQKC